MELVVVGNEGRRVEFVLGGKKVEKHPLLVVVVGLPKETFSLVADGIVAVRGKRNYH